MKLAVLLPLVWMSFFTGVAGDAKVTYVAHDKVAKGGTFVRAPDLTIMVVTRTSRGEVEIHDKETDTFHVLEGSATLITGGTMIGGRVSGPGQQRGKDMKGGEAYQLTKGDVIVIPAGIPHWFKEVPHSITYYVVKVLNNG